MEGRGVVSSPNHKTKISRASRSNYARSYKRSGDFLKVKGPRQFTDYTSSIGAPTSECGTIQLANTPTTGRVRTFLELEEGEMEEVTEMLVVELVVCSPMQSFHLMRILGHNLIETREVGG